ETTREVAMMEIRDLVRDTFLADAPIIATSAATGTGIQELKEAIRKACRLVEDRGRTTEATGQRTDDGEKEKLSSGLRPLSSAQHFRLAIDRCFVVQGHGTVVTGSVTSGASKTGDELDWLPRGQKVRIRALHSHDKPVEEVHRGMRAA